jgi:hypothetical protein
VMTEFAEMAWRTTCSSPSAIICAHEAIDASQPSAYRYRACCQHSDSLPRLAPSNAPAKACYFELAITPLNRSLITAADGTPPRYIRQVGSGSGGLGTGIPKMSRSAYSNVGVG